jgi:acetyl esterase/lipase
MQQISSMPKQYPIESLLSARHMFAPQVVDNYVYFLSNMSGVLSLYRMNEGGSLPEPLLPSGLALQNPHLIVGESYVVLPSLGKILVMIDNNGDENYQPSFVPIEGGVPERIFGDKYAGEQIACTLCDKQAAIAYFHRDDRKTPDQEAIRVDLKKMEEISMGKSKYGHYVTGANRSHSESILVDGYTAADNVLYLWEKKSGTSRLLFGTPLEKREEGKKYPLTGISRCNFTDDGKGLLVVTTLFEDSGTLGFLPFSEPSNIQRVSITGLRHAGSGEMVDVVKIGGPRDRSYLLQYNIDGCTWLYEGILNYVSKGSKYKFDVTKTIIGKSPVSDGVALGFEPDFYSKRVSKKTASKQKSSGLAFSFTTATTPSQLYHFAPSRSSRKSKSSKKNRIAYGYTMLSSEKVLGIPEDLLSTGEDASYDSFDGLRISARMYLPSPKLGFKEPYPLVLYVHGGPQGQERPDFTWFSMPLIQYLTLRGIAVFVPNVRGSTGYGQKFMKMVDHDWGGKDRLDLVEGLKVIEAKDSRIDSSRRGVIGRSYGGYMTLTLVSRHPELWKAGVDMFGPYNLLTFIERLPEAWRTYFYLAVGHPEKDRDFLIERSPSTYMDNVRCAMLMIQGQNDPRVVERETRDVVERVRSKGVPVDYLVFEDEGHDVIKFKNRVIGYNKIADFFEQNLSSSSSMGQTSATVAQAPSVISQVAT